MPRFLGNFKQSVGESFGKSVRRNNMVESREADAMYEVDKARTSRRRGNQRVKTTKELIMQSIFVFVFGFLFTFVLFGFLLGTLWHTLINMAYEMMGNLDIFGIEYLYPSSYYASLFYTTKPYVLINLFISFTMACVLYVVASGQRRRKNVTDDHTDINTYVGDRYVLTPEEIVIQYDVFPDAGAHCRKVSPSSIVSHIYLTNKGLDEIKVPVRDDEGNHLRDNDGKLRYKTVPMIDENLRVDGYNSVGVRDKKEQYAYDPNKIIYKIDTKTGKKITLADHINENWYIPDYEHQRPAGAFLVETGAVNTFVIAITRGNKGQLSVNNTIDMMSREHEPQNLFVNDPKGGAPRSVVKSYSVA